MSRQKAGNRMRVESNLARQLEIRDVWCSLLHNGVNWNTMGKLEKVVRQSVSLPTHIAKDVRAIARNRRTSANRVLLDLIEAGLQAKEEERKRFFSLATRLSKSVDAVEQQRIKEELARMTFGE